MQTYIETSTSSAKPYWQRFKKWAQITPEQWNDWHWQYQNLVTTPEEFVDLFPMFENEVNGIRSTLGKYKFTATPYYLSLIDEKNAECPIKLQTVPSRLEMRIEPGVDMRDPLAEDTDMPVPGLVHRYPDRVLFLITEICSVYCRFCTRRRVILEKASHIDRQIDQGIGYIQNHPEIHDVIISGGDALVVGEKLLESVISRLRAMPHIYTIRIGSRIPVVCPMRITPSLVAMLKKYQPLYFMTHFNHPYEITPEAKKACALLVDNGIPVMNQSVLLRKVNSCPSVMRKLCYDLIAMRVKPYYLYQCDLSEGIGHFRTPIQTGIEIIESLRGHISGLAIPTFVIDAPGGGGKIPILPDYVVRKEKDKIVLRNYEQKEYIYPEPHDTDCSCSTSKAIKSQL
ncbi:MAG: lysine 2,3-aminomutase [Deltaproteobacteria bacterium GWA2_45_12]|nr:MAG: lysine 2,3-aminomutase [Deltaproteobacteria bacterium GWA2_45_12]